MKNGSAPVSNGRKFFTAKEAADYCSINVNTLYRMLNTPPEKGGPPCKRMGWRFRFPKEKFIAWAENSTEGTS